MADAVIIGGGAAGTLCAALAAGRGLKTVLLEPNRELGRKLRITGKGLSLIHISEPTRP